MPNTININDTKYNIKGCIMHMGGLNGGHYVYFHKFQRSCNKFNDESISYTNEEDDIKKYGYIYLYEKCD